MSVEVVPTPRPGEDRPPAGSGDVIPFPAQRRGRGRPKKDKRATPCTGSFESVRLPIAVVATGKDAATRALWAAAKEAARSAALNDGRLRNASRRVLDFLINKINRQHGFDWHGIDAIAAGCIDCQTGRALDRGTVVDALKELSLFGYILRRMQPVRGGRPGHNKRGETTLPILVRYIAEVREARSKIAGRMVANKCRSMEV